MAVLPGSLDYLYYNGILDHIPYEAYEQLPVNVGMNASQSLGSVGMPAGSAYSAYNGTQYLDAAMSGNAYGAYNSSYDSYTPSRPEDVKIGQDASLKRTVFGINNGVGDDADMVAQLYGQDGKSIKDTVLRYTEAAKEKGINIPAIVMGALGLVTIAGTLVALLRGKKKP